MFRFVLFIFCSFTIVMGGSAAYVMHWLNNPVESGQFPIELQIKEGASYRDLSLQLAEVVLIQHPFAMRWLAAWEGKDKSLKKGWYLIEKPMNPKEVVNFFHTTSPRLLRVTFPEGFNMYQIAKRLEEQVGGVKFAELAKVLESPPSELKELLPFDVKTLEGVLFPDTYEFEPHSAPLQLIKPMIKRFVQKTSLLLKKNSQRNQLSAYQVLTLASLIEKETGKKEERPLISGVFHNRLDKKMKLQTDPSVIYGIWKTYDGNLKKSHLLTPGPYNSYTEYGLPPGPIANPGLESIQAALEPASTKALFFVGKGDGSHTFAETLEKHNQSVKKYQIDPYLKSLKKGPK